MNRPNKHRVTDFQRACGVYDFKDHVKVVGHDYELMNHNPARVLFGKDIQVIIGYSSGIVKLHDSVGYIAEQALPIIATKGYEVKPTLRIVII